MILVYWTKYTATLHGQVLKFVPCENCSTEYVYVLEREGSGVGTSVYMLNDEGAQDHATSAADDTLRSYLENDFDPVPGPTCGHYQRYMFPKLQETRSPWGPAATLVVLAFGCLAAVGGLYWSIAYLQQPNDHALERMVAAWSLVVVLGLVGVGLSAIKRSQVRRFDPNSEDRQARIEKGRSRAVTRAEFEKTQQRERGAEGTGFRT
ncbi:MAG TPA: hypothetical protein VFG68_04015 [Fimbriiglobus sp.]|nr:hypothetical protein [Fimbriiglobus sp.]